MKKLFLVVFAVLLLASLSFADTEALSDQPAQQANQVSLGRAPNVQSVYPFQSMPFNFRGANGPAYGQDAIGGNWMRIPLINPAGSTVIAPLVGDFFGGDFGPGGVFYAVDFTNNQLVTVDTLTGVFTVVGPMLPPAAGQAWTGIGWDASTSTMYASSTDITTSYLSTVDINTGAVTAIGSTTVAAGIIDIGVDNFGNIYAHDIVSNAIYTIDPATGAATMLGATGFDANYAQGMDFNPETGELYLAAYNNTVSAAELRLVDLTTGNTTLVGPIGAGAGVEVTAFGIAGSAGDDLDPKPPTNFVAYSDYMTPTSMLLTWTDPTEYINGNPLTNFTIEIARDGVPIASVPMGTETYSDAGLVDGTLYTYDIWAKDNVDSTSSKVSASWYAGGAPKPMPPAAFGITSASGGQLMAHWTNPSENIDGTPMDDFAAINLYENGTLLTTFTRSTTDTGAVDSALFTPTGTNLEYWATAVDNETPPNESDPSNSAFPPYAAPYLVDFEGATVGTPGVLPPLWTNEIDDDFDWYVNAGGTVSSGTGPTVDHTTGTAAGKYMYTESSSPNFPNKVAHLTTPFIDISSVTQPGLSFWYHMFGAEMGELHVDVFYNGAWVLDVMPPLIGQQQANQTDPWLQALVDLSAYSSSPIKVRFRGITGTSYTSDMAIDDVYFTTMAGAPTMIVSTTAMGDTLLVGATSSQMFTITNGTAAPSVLNYTITENPPVNWLSATPDNGSITSLNHEDITVNFDATVVTAGTYTTELLIAGDDPLNPEDTISVTLVANETPIISISPDSIHFDIQSGAADSAIFTISNLGNGPLEILSIEDEEASVDDFTPSWVQPQAPDVFTPKGVDGVYRGDVTDGSGGPDPFGYKWIDSDEPSGPPYQFTDISGTGTVVNLLPTGTFDPKDEGMATLTLPWDIKFYGNNYNQIQVNSNGVIVLDMSYFANMFSNVGIPNTDDPNLYMAPFWDDLDGRAGGEIYYQAIGNKFIVQWDHWGHYPSGTEGLIFQAVFFQNSATIWFVYEDMALAETDATVGIENDDGTIGLQVAFDQAYVHSQLLTKISKGAEWLTEEPTSGTIPPAGSMDVKVKASTGTLLGGNYLANVIVSSNDPLTPVVKLPKVSMFVIAEPDIAVKPDSIIYETPVVLGGSAVKTLTVYNNAAGLLNVSNIASSNPVFTVSSTSFSVPPFDSLQLDVTFTPTAVAVETGTLTITSNDPDTPTLDVYVEGEGIATPVIVVTPDTFDVVVASGTTHNETMTISNTGAGPLLFDIEIEGTDGEMVPIHSRTRLVQRTLIAEDMVKGHASPFAEVSPNLSNEIPTSYTDALWDLQFSFDVEAVTGALGNAGSEFDGTYYYTTRWASNLIHKIDMSGNLVEEFSIPGVSGLRDLAFDGTYMYGGAAANQIFQMDFTTKTLIGTIPTPEAVRHIAYDSDLDAFWIGNWSTDIYLVDRTGATLATIPAATHGTTSNYGTAYDNWSTGGPYLWIFSQGAGAGTPQLIYQLDLAAGGTQTGVTHDVTGDFPGPNNIAGGLFTAPGIVTGTVSIGGLLQGTPDMFFVYELAPWSGGAGWLTANITSGTVPAGGNQPILLTFDPTGLLGGDYHAKIKTNSNDPTNPQVKVGAHMFVQAEPDIAVSPDSLLFQTILVGATDSLVLTVFNNGAGVLNITSMVSSNPAFVLGGPVPSQVAPLSSEDVMVYFIPLVPGVEIGTLTITSDDPDTPTLDVYMEGQGNEAPVIAVTPDTFDVTVTSGDILKDTLYVSNVGNGPLVFSAVVGGNLPELIYFQFDEPGQTQTPNNANPQTAVSQYGTLMGGMTMGGSGFAGSALIGTGGSSASDYVDANWITNLGTDSWTISLWLNNVDMSTSLYYHFGDNTANSFRCFSGGVAGAGNLMLRGPVSDVTVTGVGPGPSIVDFVYDASVPEVRAYLNGVLNTTVPQAGVNIVGSANFKVGGYSSSTGMAAGELMDEFKLFDHAIDVTEEFRSSWLTLNPDSGTVAPAGTIPVELTFDPSGLLGGDYTTKIIITSNDPVTPEVNIGVHMFVQAEANIEAHPDSLAFSDTLFVGATETKMLYVVNSGAGVLNVTGITSSNPLFTVDTSVFDVPPYDSVGVGVTFAPVAIGAQTGMLSISSNDPQTPVLDVPYSGEAIPAPIAAITPNYNNPVLVADSDSVDVSINVSNSGGSPLHWSAVLSQTQMVRKVMPRVYGPSETSQFIEVDPNATGYGSGTVVDALWDLQFSFNLELVTGALGNAGAEFDGTYYYTTRWASNLIHRMDMSGNLVEEFSIPGVSGLRDLAFDGTYMYGGAAANQIYMMDFTTKTLIGTIPTPEAVRHIAYDASVDGFWIGNWSTDIYLVDRTGATLSVIPAAVHGTQSNYGTAWDDYSAGGPYLWIFSQGTGAGTPQLIYQLDIAAGGTQTGVTHDVTGDFPGPNNIAGGLWVGEGVVTGKASIGGCLQGTPDMFFVYELAETVPPWLVFTGPTSGVIAPADNFNVPLRVYGITPVTRDSIYVVFTTNDPNLPLANILLIREPVYALGDPDQLPTTFAVKQNYPNPFNPTTTIKYQLPQSSDVHLVIYNVLGQKVRTLLNTRKDAGYYQVVWDGRNDQGVKLATG
ncbi:MAG TPA: choice-of-anchor D domain-containing protein, partial [Caldithrix sp.]|nr:choice-of-anchor D domain-containing protein [Caldithrix sp.]